MPTKKELEEAIDALAETVDSQKAEIEQLESTLRSKQYDLAQEKTKTQANAQEAENRHVINEQVVKVIEVRLKTCYSFDPGDRWEPSKLDAAGEDVRFLVALLELLG